MGKENKPPTACDLASKLGSIWKDFQPWRPISLGHGFFEFQFDSLKDKPKAWSVGTYNLRPGLLRLSDHGLTARILAP
ncbi:NBS resistance protein, partial [Trifolium medium]|nr:NBS resistance protein [Trifolium medium]